MLYLRRTGFPKGVLSPFPHSPPEIAGPQSNQRGIETKRAILAETEDEIRLNRTSVGLKPYQALIHSVFHVMSLNRTSVGLKRRSFSYDTAVK